VALQQVLRRFHLRIQVYLQREFPLLLPLLILLLLRLLFLLLRLLFRLLRA
jgi:hypothetical protein